ncbi:hypothetical protein FRB94_001919 [Tulasnella sp. JGI-2019a]|nr:hypothetical protein FRB93_013178 [Tulasnella sp. JGI-2019a]KAG8987400.1 hypothetical protein FRB94_001919 [Tulasnella sp. JGI-2019a]
MRIPSCKSLDIEQFDATGPTFSASRNHLIPSLSSILLAASRVSIDIGSTFLEYRVTAKINQDYDGDEDDEGEGEDGEDDMMVKCIRIHASGDQFTGGFAMETLSWLLDNLHTPSFSLPVSLTIGEPDSSALIIERLSSTITYLELCLSGASAKTIVSYLAEPFNAVIDGMATLRWPLPNLTNISFQRCNDIEPEVILGCIQRRAGRGLSSEGRREHREELPAKLTRLRLPRGSSITELKRVFPDCIEWGGPELELELAREERRNRYIRSEEIISDSDE